MCVLDTVFMHVLKKIERSKFGWCKVDRDDTMVVEPSNSGENGICRRWLQTRIMEGGGDDLDSRLIDTIT